MVKCTHFLNVVLHITLNLPIIVFLHAMQGLSDMYDFLCVLYSSYCTVYRVDPKPVLCHVPFVNVHVCTN